MMMSTRNQEEQAIPHELLPTDDSQSEAPSAENSSRLGTAGLFAPTGADSPAVGQSPPDSDAVSTSVSVISALKEIVQIVLPAIFLAALIHLFLAQATIVRGQSMQPNLRPEERLIMEKLSYYFHAPRHNEIVVLDMPESPALIIKRVVGLPGETVEIQQGHLLVDGRDVVAPPDAIAPRWRALVGGDDGRPPSNYGDSISNYGPITLADDVFFVLGDNRDNSNDSRAFGPVHRDLIKGRIWVRYWPLTRLTIFR